MDFTRFAFTLGCDGLLQRDITGSRSGASWVNWLVAYPISCIYLSIDSQPECSPDRLTPLSSQAGTGDTRILVHLCAVTDGPVGTIGEVMRTLYRPAECGNREPDHSTAQRIRAGSHAEQRERKCLLALLNAA